jgi:hypothetical protein
MQSPNNHLTYYISHMRNFCSHVALLLKCKKRKRKNKETNKKTCAYENTIVQLCQRDVSNVINLLHI